MEVTKDQGYFACDRCNVNSKQDYVIFYVIIGMLCLLVEEWIKEVN